MNRFQDIKEYGEKILSFKYNGREYEVRATSHSLLRFKERKIDLDAAAGCIVALGKARLDYFATAGEDVAIIDRVNKICVIITFETEGNYTQIRIATIIKKENVFVKDGTKIYVLK